MTRRGNAQPGTAPRDRVLRFRDSERLLHWAIALPFLLCAASAIVLVLFYNPSPQRPLRALFSWVHRLSGACFLTVPLLIAFRHRKDIATYWSNVREAWGWSRADFKWLLLQGPASIGRKTALPEAGKFNAGQKLNFMMVMTTWPLFALTGALIWFSDVAFVSWLVHFLAAAIAVPLVAGHIYMAVLNPATRKGLSGMTTGFVDRHWAAHHHPRWYREAFGTAPTAPTAPAAPVARAAPVRPAPLAPPRPASAGGKAVALRTSAGPAAEKEPAGDLDPMERPALILCSACQTEHEVSSWTVLLERFFTTNSIPCPGCGVEMVTLNPVLTDPELLEPILRRLEGRGTPARTPAPTGPGTGRRERLALAGASSPAPRRITG